MKTLFPIVLAAVLAAPVQADECSDFRLSVRERDAAVALLSKPATDEEIAAELVSRAALAYQRRDAAERALLANRGDDLVAGIVKSLDEAHTGAIKASSALSLLGDGPQGPSTIGPERKVMSILSAIEEVRDAVVYTLCE